MTWASICNAQAIPTGNRLRELVPPDFAVGGALRLYAEGGGYHFSTYRELASREFDTVTATAFMPDGPWASADAEIDASSFVDICQWANSHLMRVHGRALISPSENLRSKVLQDLPDTDVEAKLQKYVSEIVGATAGKVWVWSVVDNVVGNYEDQMDGSGLRTGEQHDDNLIAYKEFSAMGKEYIVKAFRWAHEADPNVTLIINESGAEEINSKSDRLLQLCKKLRSEDVPIAGVGFKHRWLDPNVTPDYESIRNNMKRFADAGLQIYMTDVAVASIESGADVDVPLTTEQLERQKNVYKELLKLALEQPACKAFWMSDFADGQFLPQSNATPSSQPTSSLDHSLHATVFWGGDTRGKSPLAAKRAYYGLQEALVRNPPQLYRLTSGWESASSYLVRNSDQDQSGNPQPGATVALSAKTEEALGWTSMKWSLERATPGVYRIRCSWGEKSGYLTRLGTPSGDATTELCVIPVDYSYESQLWKLVPQGNAGYHLVNQWAPGDGVLTREANGTDSSGNFVPGTTLRLYHPADWTSQVWYFSRAD